MKEFVYLIASESHSSGTNYLPFVLIAAGVVGAVLVQRSRTQKARTRVVVRRVPDDGRVELAGPKEASNSLAVGVRAWPDELGTVTLLEGAT
jgi:hypothetical protein